MAPNLMNFDAASQSPRPVARRHPPGRRTNLGLLAALAGAFVTGVTMQAVGSSSGRWLVVLHGSVGIAAIFLSPGKTKIAAKGFERKNRGRWVSLMMGALAGAILTSGILHTTGLSIRVGPVTMLWLHVTAALALIPFLVWHVLAHKTYPKAHDLSRRNLLRLGGLAAVGSGSWWGADRAIRLAGLPGSLRRFTGSHEVSSFDPDGFPVTSWLDDRPPSIDVETWSVAVADAAGSNRFSLADLARLGVESLEADLDCTSGWWSRQRWGGVRLDRLVIPGEARSVVVRSATGYGRRLPVTELDHLWIVTMSGDGPLSRGHGYPARLVAPGRRGFWWVKWVTSVETSMLPSWLQPPYPLT